MWQCRVKILVGKLIIDGRDGPSLFQWNNLPASLNAFMANNRPEAASNPFRYVLFSESGGWWVRRETRYDSQGLSSQLLHTLNRLQAYNLNRFLLEFVMGKDDQVICITTKGDFYWDNIPQDTELWRILQQQWERGKNLECAALSFHSNTEYFLRFGDSVAYSAVRQEYRGIVDESVRSGDWTHQQTEQMFGAVMPMAHMNLLQQNQFWHHVEGNPLNNFWTHHGDAQAFGNMMNRLQNVNFGTAEVARPGTGDISLWP
jgi:hypothetical protein